MKKVLAAILVLVYFTVSSGFTVSMHYCMGRFDSVRLGTDESDTCGKCGMHKADNPCCRDEVKVFKLESSHKAAVLPVPDFSVAAVLPFFYTAPVIMWTTTVETAIPLPHGPPPLGQETYLLNCVFRI